MKVLEHHHHRAWSASRSKNSRQPENRSARSEAGRRASPSRCASRGSTRRRSAGRVRAARPSRRASRGRRRGPRSRRSAPACAPSRPAPRSRRPRRRRGSGRGASRRARECRRCTSRTPRQPRSCRARVRRWPAPARRRRLGACARRRGSPRRSSRSRPTSGASGPVVRARRRRRWRPRAARSTAGPARSSPSARARRRHRARSPPRCAAGRLVDEDVPGPATDWRRAAVLTASPITMPLSLGAEPDCGLAGDDADARPQLDPDPLAERAPRRWLSRAPARTARSASSSCACGDPQTAITASPMNFSTVPPWLSIASAELEVLLEHLADGLGVTALRERW